MDNKGQETESGYYSDEVATFGDRVSAAREAIGMSREELARRLGVKLKTVLAWEEDVSEPRANKLQMLSGILRVSLPWLIMGEGEGLENPAEPGPGEENMEELARELSEIKARMLALHQDMGRYEKKMLRAIRARK